LAKSNFNLFFMGAQKDNAKNEKMAPNISLKATPVLTGFMVSLIVTPPPPLVINWLLNNRKTQKIINPRLEAHTQVSMRYGVILLIQEGISLLQLYSCVAGNVH